MCVRMASWLVCERQVSQSENGKSEGDSAAHHRARSAEQSRLLSGQRCHRSLELDCVWVLLYENSKISSRSRDEAGKSL